MVLSEVFPGAPDIKIEGICLDSRKAKKGDIFFCFKGIETDGHKYAAKACEAGAVAVVHSEDIPKMDGVAYIKSDDVIGDLNKACDVFFDSPSKKMTVFGVTGTNGKSTITSIISDVYEKPCGYMGTIAVRYGDVSREPSLTTPDSVEIHSSLKEMVDHNMEAVAMEVSSHGLDMGRVDVVDFDVAVFTNMTYDHLDYHKTMENYFAAKKKLFTNMKKTGIAVLNVDDISFDELAACVTCPYVTYGIEKAADYSAQDIELSTTGTTFTLVCKGKKYPVKTNLVATYNVCNLLSAIAAMHEVGMPIEDMLPKLAHIRQVDGRMENIDLGQDFNVIIDYAHTPDGYEKLFSYATKITEGNIYIVFGCSGKRDKPKRKVLGGIAGKYCEKIFITEEDPRDERVIDIAKDIISGIPEGKDVFIEDRYSAIEAAIFTAKKGDCVMVLGKGDETYMCYADGGKSPWMGDNEAARRALKKLLSK